MIGPGGVSRGSTVTDETKGPQGMLAAADGTVAVEYAIVGAGIAVLIAASVFALGNQISERFYDSLVRMFSGG